jgi:hypothetical protein
MAGMKQGKADVRPDVPSHVRGIKQGNSKGNYASMPGHSPDGKSTARRSTGINPANREPIDPRMPNISPA